MEIDRESNIQTELFASSIEANSEQTLIAKNIGNVATIMKSSIFKRLIEAVRSAILTRRDVCENDIRIRGCDIHRIERFCVDSAEFFLFSIVSAII